MPKLRTCIGLGGDGEQSAKGNIWRYEKENVGNNRSDNCYGLHSAAHHLLFGETKCRWGHSVGGGVENHLYSVSRYTYDL